MIKHIQADLNRAIKTLYNLDIKVGVEVTKDIANGDYCTMVAMQLAKLLKQAPLKIAGAIVDNLISDDYQTQIAAPGFINFKLTDNNLLNLIKTINIADEDFGQSDYGKKQKVNVEFVSANPTGPLHLGHARQAAIGDSLCRLLSKAGFLVTREYYYNDCGNQVNILGQSLLTRYRQLSEADVVMPEDAYFGEDIKIMAEQLKKEHGANLANNDLSFFIDYAVTWQKKQIAFDLALFRVQFDVYTSEKVIRASGKIEQLLSYLKENDYAYINEGALWLKTSQYGDDKDRVLIKNDRSFTYLVPDIAYHQDKLQRHYDYLIDLLGADHHGYLARMKAALTMLNYNSDCLDFIIVQMVRMVKDGKEIKLSKRSGLSVTINDLIEEIGVDAARYIFASRAANSHLDIDIDLLTKKGNENPVFYAQYAHARTCSIINLASSVGVEAEPVLLTDYHLCNSERALIILLADFPNVIVDAASARAPHRISLYIQKVAQAFHSFYGECKVLDQNQLNLTKMRLSLVKASRIIFRNSLLLLGVSAPEKM